MDDKHPHCDLWRSCEFFLCLAPSGVNLRSFDLIRETYQGKTTSDAFIFERITRKVISLAFASIIGFMRDEAEKAQYLFTVRHKLEASDMQQFQVFLSNGLNAVLKKEKRFLAPAREQGDSPCLKIGVVPHGEILAIVERTVDQHLDPAVDWAVQHQMSVAGNRPRAKLARQIDKTFLLMNRHL